MNAQPPDERQVLIVEDSRTFSSMLTRVLQKELGLESLVCRDFAGVKAALGQASGAFLAALVDLNLPDAPMGAAVDLMSAHDIPVIVFTGEISEDLREYMWSKRIVDYVVKGGPENVTQILGVVKRLRNNLGKKVLVVDDSPSSLKLISGLLAVWNFQVIECHDGLQALEALGQEKDVALLLTDYKMPRMDGVDLVKAVRRIHSKARLPIIGLSGEGGGSTSAYFIKSGANDFLSKPFLVEELYCRVMHNLETAEYIALVRDLAERDFLTGLSNRRSFFSYGTKLFASHRRGQIGLVLAMIDIDHFKRCNDTFGHDAGDEVIKAVAQILTARFRETDLVARLGGEEFAVACVNMDPAMTTKIFENLRQAVQDAVVTVNGQDIKITISIGLCAQEAPSLEAMLKVADLMLYQAKNSGRNQVCLAGPAPAN